MNRGGPGHGHPLVPAHNVAQPFGRRTKARASRRLVSGRHGALHWKPRAVHSGRGLDAEVQPGVRPCQSQGGLDAVAAPDVRWCGGRGLKSPAYPIRSLTVLHSLLRRPAPNKLVTVLALLNRGSEHCFLVLAIARVINPHWPLHINLPSAALLQLSARVHRACARQELAGRTGRRCAAHPRTLPVP